MPFASVRGPERDSRFFRHILNELVYEYEKTLSMHKKQIEAEGFEVETRTLPGFSPAHVNKICEEEGYSLTVVVVKEIYSFG